MSFLLTLSKSGIDTFTEKSYISWQRRMLQKQKGNKNLTEKQFYRSNFFI